MAPGIVRRISRALAALLGKEEPPPPADVCLHDEEDRLDARRMGHPNAWICRRCGYRSDA